MPFRADCYYPAQCSAAYNKRLWLCASELCDDSGWAGARRSGCLYRTTCFTMQCVIWLRWVLTSWWNSFICILGTLRTTFGKSQGCRTMHLLALLLPLILFVCCGATTADMHAVALTTCVCTDDMCLVQVLFMSYTTLTRGNQRPLRLTSWLGD